ncbi:MAG TPA: alpha/beta hydrolase, partial [Limnochordia bacterium]|nr:alpha/beta hydrolase [Limnochordia bacterium]
GQSAAPSGSYRMDELAGDVVGLLDALDIKRAVIGGHSMGGYLAFALWRLAPERIKGLALINTRAAADTRAGRAGRYQNAADALRDGVAAVVPRLAAKMYAPQAPAQQTAALAERMARTPLDGLVGALLGMAERPDSTPLLPQIGVPCAVIAGAEDQIVPAAEAEAMAAALPEAELSLIPGAGHMSMEERPEAVNAALLRLLARA